MRGRQSSNTFVNNGNGTISDTSSGLMWQQDTARNTQGNYDAMTWEEALRYCETLTLGGHTDWRLPTIKELLSFADFSCYPAINHTYFPDTLDWEFYWSSTTYPDDTNHALAFEFPGIAYYTNKSSDSYVRAVRGLFELYVSDLGSCGGKKPCYSSIQAAMNVAEHGAVINVGHGVYKEAPIKSAAVTVTISGGWNDTFTEQTGTTSMYAPRATGGAVLKVQPNIKIVAP